MANILSNSEGWRPTKVSYIKKCNLVFIFANENTIKRLAKTSDNGDPIATRSIGS